MDETRLPHPPPFLPKKGARSRSGFPRRMSTKAGVAERHGRIVQLNMIILHKELVVCHFSLDSTISTAVGRRRSALSSPRTIPRSYKIPGVLVLLHRTHALPVYAKSSRTPAHP
ncbi:uncharacterized protein BDZ83DRAFT_179102 [Colletotrichum acutatum]|uniref:Uncharacterized protein n=1 Tax=Glomerella acutata TaxID=27357 RepID=A0AAD8US93_GLOAC|nr:uncharacterized protein BDZ83DRAFT_179102 [Colletotrichum acutatum]KAK1727867.1 hypothetical protein BDZ83DRAFT_179102 [Colletotrichum acutatum]